MPLLCFFIDDIIIPTTPPISAGSGFIAVAKGVEDVANGLEAVAKGVEVVGSCLRCPIGFINTQICSPSPYLFQPSEPQTILRFFR